MAYNNFGGYSDRNNYSNRNTYRQLNEFNYFQKPRNPKPAPKQTPVSDDRRRSYEIHLESGGIIYKYYRPSEMKKILDERVSKPEGRTNKWKKIIMVGKIG